MKTYNTAELLNELQQQTETLLDKAIGSWQMLPPARFSAAPADGGWSAAQCLDHLNGYGDYYLPLLRAAIARAGRRKDHPATFRPGWLGDYFTKLMLPAPDGTAAKEMKAFKQHIPPAGGDSDAIIAAFIGQQEAILQLLEDARGTDLGRRAIPVSIAKFVRLKTGDTFRFLVAHNLRHAAQAERALARAAPAVF